MADGRNSDCGGGVPGNCMVAHGSIPNICDTKLLPSDSPWTCQATMCSTRPPSFGDWSALAGSLVTLAPTRPSTGSSWQGRSPPSLCGSQPRFSRISNGYTSSTCLSWSAPLEWCLRPLLLTTWLGSSLDFFRVMWSTGTGVTGGSAITMCCRACWMLSWLSWGCCCICTWGWRTTV